MSICVCQMKTKEWRKIQAQNLNQCGCVAVDEEEEEPTARGGARRGVEESGHGRNKQRGVGPSWVGS